MCSSDLELLPRAALVTPNRPEAEALTGLRIRTDAEVEAAGRRLLSEGCQAVLIKGGHAAGPVCRDCLVVPGRKPVWFKGRRIRTRNSHGTGCVLSAAIAWHLARGDPLVAAIRKARAFLMRGLAGGRRARLGHGAGPAFLG